VILDDMASPCSARAKAWAFAASYTLTVQTYGPQFARYSQRARAFTACVI
jgi:hypothetical protein